MKATEVLRVPEKDAKWVHTTTLFLWLLKDAAWASHWLWLGSAAIVPTLALAAKVTWDSRREVGDLIHNVAACAWLGASAAWMLGELFGYDIARPHVKLFFLAGTGVLLAYYAFTGARRLIDAHHIRNVVHAPEERPRS